MGSNRMQTEEARRRAHEKFAKADKREKNLLKEKNKAIGAMVSKTVRLRALRLAKEASDKEAADKEAAQNLAAKKKPTKPVVAKGV